MLLDDSTYNELLGIKASALVLAERADKVIKKQNKLRGISIPSSKKTEVLSKEQEAKILSKKRTGQIKKATASTAA